MSILGSLEVLLSLENSKFVKGIDESLKKVDGLSGGLAKVGGFAFAGAVAGVGVLTAGLGKSVASASEAEGIQAQLQAVLKSTGGIAGITADRVNDLASNLSTLTKFEDDAIVEGQNMLLTFTNIGADGGIFDQTTEIMLDMSQAMGSDLSSTAIQLGKALNNPTQGLTALSRVGVAFTDEQKTMIQTMQEAGDMAGAQQIILNELKNEFGGSAQAAGKTFAGALAIAKNSIGNVFETIGGKLLPVLTKSSQKLATWINAPETQAKIESIANAVANFAGKVAEFIPKAIDAFMKVVNFLSNNKPIIIGILTALGIAVGVWAVQTAIAGWAAMAPFLPIIAILIAIAAVVALFAKAWQSDFLGIKTATTGAFAKIKEFWNSTLKPVFQQIWDFLSAYIFPIFKAIGNFIGAVFSVYFKILGAIFTNIIIPALKILFSWMAEKLFPVLQKVANWVGQKLTPAFNGLNNILSKVVDWFNKLADKMQNLKLPKWLTPGSPFPFTISLIGLNEELKKSAGQILPEFSTQLNFNGQMPLAGKSAIQSSNNAELISAIKNSKTEIDYNQLARTLVTAIQGA